MKNDTVVTFHHPRPITPQFAEEHLKEYLSSYCLCECEYCAHGHNSSKCPEDNCCLFIALNTVCHDLNKQILKTVVFSELFEMLDNMCNKLREETDVCCVFGEICPISGYISSLRDRILGGGL